jgi:hypothetical protein
MNNLQDELAWLNHRLDNKLEEWRKLHRLHGRFNAFLVYCLLISLIVILFKWSSLSTVENTPYVFVISVATVGSMLSFGVLSWMLYGRLLTMGHKSKGRIEHSHLVIPQIAEGTFLEKRRGEFNNLLRIERSFPFADKFKRLAFDAIRGCLSWAKNNAKAIVISRMAGHLEYQLNSLEQQLVNLEGDRKEIEAGIVRLAQDYKSTKNNLDRRTRPKPQQPKGLRTEGRAYWN